MSNQYSSINEYVEQKGFYEAVVEDGADIIFIVDYNGKILYHNPSARENLGYPQKILEGSIFFDYILPDIADNFKTHFKNCVQEPYVENIEFTFLKNDMTYSHLEFNSVNLNHKEGINGLILDCRDINQRKRDAAELLRAQKAKEQFMANMSHEIRTPINGIAGMINLIAETKLSLEQKKYINAIKNSSDNLKVIINDILDISVIESGKLKFETIGFSIKHQLRSIVDTFLHQAIEKNIYLDYDVDLETDLVVLGDPVRLNQILMNLISNALKFTDKGGININVKALRVAKNGVNITFEVTDSGIGIASEKLDTIFESFSQADESVTRKYGGTGLGLAISKQLVELQNGSIEAKSKENIGTTFSFSIPYQIGESEDLILKNDQTSIAKEGQNSLEAVKVLLVEDNDINRMYAANILKKWKCQYDTAENGYIATEKLKKGRYDLILMDVQMPVMDGIEATKVIRKNFPEPVNKIPIIALTANVLKDDPQKYKNAGMDGFLSKPFLPEELYDIIIDHVGEQNESPVFQNQQKVANEVAPIELQENIINLKFLKKTSDGDNVFLKELIVSYLESTPETISKMKQLYQEDDWDKLGKTAHKIKPSIKLMGINIMHEIVLEIENTCESSSDKSLLESLISRLETYSSTACDQLNHELKQL